MYSNKADVLTDKELSILIESCRRNDRYGQSTLYKRLYGYAFTICARYMGNNEEAEEMVQDGFYKIFTQIQKYGGELSFYAWFKKILINTCIDRYRSNIRQQQTTDLEENIDATGLPEALIEADVNHLLHLVQSLSPAYRTTFCLYAIEGYGYQEIADMLQINIGSVKSNLSKARQQLKQLLLQPHKNGDYYAR